MDNIRVPWEGWRVVKLLGSGSFGNVYEIERHLYGHMEKSAMKCITIPRSREEIDADYDEGYDNESIREKYNSMLQDILNEYKLMSELKGHANIVSCEDVYTEKHTDGIGWNIYIRMEKLTSLNTLLREKELSEIEIIRLGKDMCRALIACEKKHIIHRDIKPGNIMVSAYGDYKLGDFGIARTMDHSTNATRAGTEKYMAPEIIKHERYGNDVDIYSLGLVMYWLLNKRRMPFVPADKVINPAYANEAQYRRINGEKLPAPYGGSRSLKAIVLKACEYDRNRRYHTASEMLEDLNYAEGLCEQNDDETVQIFYDDNEATETVSIAMERPKERPKEEHVISERWNPQAAGVKDSVPKQAAGVKDSAPKQAAEKKQPAGNKKPAEKKKRSIPIGLIIAFIMIGCGLLLDQNNPDSIFYNSDNTEITEEDEFYESAINGALCKDGLLTYGPVCMEVNPSELTSMEGDETDLLLCDDGYSGIYVKKNNEFNVSYEKSDEEGIADSYEKEDDVSKSEVLEFKKFKLGDYKCIVYEVKNTYTDNSVCYMAELIVFEQNEDSTLRVCGQSYDESLMNNIVNNMKNAKLVGKPLTSDDTDKTGYTSITLK